MLDERTNNRIGAIGGIGYALCFAVGWAFWRLPGLPNASSAADVSQWFVVHQSQCRTAAILGCLALFFFMWFECRLYSILRRAEGGDGMITRVFFAGQLIFVAFDMMFLQFLWKVCYRPGQTLPEVTQALNDLYLGPGVAAFGCSMAAFLATAWIVLKTRCLPRWAGHTATAVGVSQLLFIPTGFVHGGIFDIANGLLGVYVPLGTPLLWTAAVSIALLRRPSVAPTRQPVPPVESAQVRSSNTSS